MRAFCEKVQFLGHLVSTSGTSAEPEKVKVVVSWSRPRGLNELGSFVSLASHCRRFICSFADIARPLYMLTAEGQPFVWESVQEVAFQILKERLISEPIVASPTGDGEYLLDTDASLCGLSAVLQQRQSGDIWVIAYASHMVSRAEQNYSRRVASCLL